MSYAVKGDNRTPGRVPVLTLAQICRGALVTGFKGAVALAVLLSLIVAAVAIVRGAVPNFLSLSALGGWAALVGFLLFFPIGLLLRSRPLQEGTFRVTGFLATFFGLAVLVFFLCGLLQNVVSWFHYTPILVDMRNRETLLAREKLKQLETLRAAKLAELKKELAEALAGADDKEKQEITKAYLGSPSEVTVLEKQEQGELAKAKTVFERQNIRDRFDGAIRAAGGSFADNLRTFEVTLEEQRQLAALPIRDTSVGAVFAHFLFGTPSYSPEDVGIKPALFGSLWLALIMILCAVPVGTGAALYLEEYKHSGRLQYWIRVNIINLAGVPSVVYGIMGAFVFVELIFKPLHRWQEGISVRNLLGGALTLALLTLPVVIVAAQEAIRAVPNSIRQGAYALGATHWQVIRHQVLPLARPGILTGTILAVSRAIGEAAPLVLFGATTFIAYTPTPLSEFTALPIQIYNWAQRTDTPVIEGQEIKPWTYNMALASLILLLMLVVLNALAIYVRSRAQGKVRW